MKVFLALLSALALAACHGSVQDKQQSADQVFGTAKMGLVVASGLVSVYNLMPLCSDTRTPPLCYSEPVGDALNLGLAAAASAIESAEHIFAASNTDEEARLKAARVAQAVIEELTRTLARFGVTQVKAS